MVPKAIVSGFTLMLSLLRHSFGAEQNHQDPGARINLNSTALYEIESRLIRKVINDDYIRDARPAMTPDAEVAVGIEMVIMMVNELVERHQEIVVTAYLKIAWQDLRFMWNPEEYGGITFIVVPASYIWIPDIGLINSADMYSITRDVHFAATIDHEGHVMWVPAGKIAARCELDVTYFPFDNQTCTYRFESWNYPSNYLNITGESMELSPTQFVPHQQWNVIDVRPSTYPVRYDNDTHVFSRVDFTICLHRKPLYYVTYTIFPAVVLSGLQVLSHLMPLAETSNRISFSTTMLIAFSVVQVSVTENMPITSDTVPLIATYVYVVMGLIVTSILEAFLAAHCLGKETGSCPPKWLWIIIVDIIGRTVFVPIEKVHPKYIELRRVVDEKTSSAEQFAVDDEELKLPSQRKSVKNNKANKDYGTFIKIDDDSEQSMDTLERTPKIKRKSKSTLNLMGSLQRGQPGCCAATMSLLLPTISSVKKDIALLRRLCDDLQDRQLAQLSKDVWNALLDVIDRYLFLAGCSVALIIPVYLFIIFPPVPGKAIEPHFGGSGMVH